MTDQELLEMILKRLEAIEANMATQDDLARLEAQMATKDDLAGLETKMATKNDIAEINRRLNAVFEQTALLTEFRTEMNHNLKDIANTLQYLLYKDGLTEKELYTIKKSIAHK